MCLPLARYKDPTGEGDKDAAIRRQDAPSLADEHEQFGCQKEPSDVDTRG